MRSRGPRPSRCGILCKLGAYAELSRVHNVVVALVNTLVGVATALWVLGTHIDWFRLAMALLSVALVSAGGYAVNDYFDADIDALVKPYRPIPSGRVSPREAHIYSILCFACGVAAGFLASIYNGLYALAVSILLYLYPASFKRRHALTGHLIVALTGASTIVYGGLCVGAYTDKVIEALAYSMVPAAYAFTLILAREFVKALEDIEGDAARGARTIATVYGVSTASKLASLLLALVALASPLPYILGPYTILYMVPAACVALLNIVSIRDVFSGRFSRARRMLKIAFALGGLAFLADPLLHISV